MSSTDELIEIAEDLLKDSIGLEGEEMIEEDEKTGKTVDRGLAERILRTTSVENAFHFFEAEDRPLGISSDGLFDFCERIRSISSSAIGYHLRRGDFEAWIRHLGDNVLADKVRLLRDSDLSGESLRSGLYEAIKSRCDELERAARSI